MAEQRVLIEGMTPNLMYSGSTNPLPVIQAADPNVTGIYTASIANVPGVVAANTFITLTNPAGSGRTLFMVAAFVSGVSDAASASTVPMRLYRLVGLPTGGTAFPAANVFKLKTTDPTPFATVLTGNPTVTLGPAGSNTPPPVTTGAGGANFIHEIVPPPPSLLQLNAGESVAFHTTAGTTAQKWNISITWAEI